MHIFILFRLYFFLQKKRLLLIKYLCSCRIIVGLILVYSGTPWRFTSTMLYVLTRAVQMRLLYLRTLPCVWRESEKSLMQVQCTLKRYRCQELQVFIHSTVPAVHPNGWYVCPHATDLVFDIHFNKQWAITIFVLVYLPTSFSFI